MGADHYDPSHRRNHTTQSIPLQDLHGSIEEDDIGISSHVHRRTLSDRGRRLFQTSPSRGRVGILRNSYTPLDEDRPPPTLRLISSRNRVGEENSDDDLMSPLADRSGFQEATGFAGFGRGHEGEENATPFMSASALPNRQDRPETLPDASYGSEFVDDFAFDDFGHESAYVDEEDTARLTEPRNLQPMGTIGRSARPGQRHDRLSTPTVRFSIVEPDSSYARLGDDLSVAELAVSSSGNNIVRTSSMMRSLSPASAGSSLRRASTVVRKMSQRVVNISNESEIAEQSIRRRQSRKLVHQDGEPSRLESTAYTHDGSASLAEKSEASVQQVEVHDDWISYRNPLRGKTLGIFNPQSRIRTWLCDLLVNPFAEPMILLLIVFQAVLVAVDSSTSVYNDPRTRTWGTSWIDFAMVAVFSVYTTEIIARVIVSGFIINPVEYSTIDRGKGLKVALLARFRTLFALQSEETAPTTATLPPVEQRSIMRSFTANPSHPNYYGGDRQKARTRLAHRAFLRHSFNRLDFLAVVAYWISFMLSVFGLEAKNHFYLFQMMSSLRILRLLSLTSGTSIILRSLKKAAPLLLNVALLIGFFWLLFAIIGVQSFKSSLRRECVWIDPEHKQPNYTNTFQFCGGSINAQGERLQWVYEDGKSSLERKGFLCPPNSRCVSGGNPYNGTVNFDNIANSVELVFVLMTSNTYSDIMYYLTDSDYLLSALFFATGTIVMTFWLVNLLIAVITTSFQVIREQSKTSAFANQSSDEPVPEVDEQKLRKNALRLLYDRTSWLWILVIVYGLLCQCLRSAGMSSSRRNFVNFSETAVTLVLLIEIILRFISDFRGFFSNKRNTFDLALAIITAAIQIPAIHESGLPYDWLTIFQILRVYRVVLAVPFTRELLLLVVGNLSGLLNLILFVFLLTFFAALLASQLFRGEIPSTDPYGNTIDVTFDTIYNSFLGMYQILSSENWTTILYNITTFSVAWGTAWIGAMFIILWFILACFIVLNMFIAVIQENFDVSEDEKRVHQVRAFLQRKELGASSNATLSLSAMFKLRELGGRRQDPLDYGQAMLEQLLNPAVAQDFLDEHGEPMPVQTPASLSTPGVKSRPLSTIVHVGPFAYIRNRLARFFKPTEPNPFFSRIKFTRADEDVDPRSMAQEVVSAAERRKRAQRDYLVKYPTYNVALYLFKPTNRIRRLCQRVVGPGRGSERIEGAAPSPVLFFAFSAFLYLAIVGMVVLACITTPLYQREYMQKNEFSIQNWFVFTDLAFALLFTIEGIIRVIADGFFWTPHAYLRSSWGLIDGVVLITLWINVISLLFYEGNVSRAVGAFKALRALRLLNVSDSARDTFHSVIVRGGWKVLSAAFVSLSLLVPFAIYGLNLFNGKMQSCNDTSSGIVDLVNCVNEYDSSPFNWNVVAPRKAANSWYSFDNFGDSLLILFSIVSQEGWVDVMWRANSITGVFQQLVPFSSMGNAVFFVVFNLLGAVFVLTLFVSVFMRNYTEQTGVAFLTSEQRSWLELRKLLRQIAPSKRPIASKNRNAFSAWCYSLAKKKTGRWQRFVTFVLIFHLGFLCLEYYPSPSWWGDARGEEITSPDMLLKLTLPDYVFLSLTVFYVSNIVIRIAGLSWTRFLRSSWDIYSLIAVSGTLIVTILYLTKAGSTGNDQLYAVYNQLHKLFQVSIVLLIIPRNNQLDQLLKTAAASLTAIANLLATWFVLFLVYAIAFTQTFGLTRFNQNENGNVNFRNVPKALILLYRMSTGEGWNQLMEDFANVRPPLCTVSEKFLEGDCGSPEWARALFISWNILSMYIFVNMFVSLIFESFSYVYQRSSGLAAIKRSDIRRFKQAWSEYDPNGHGYITKKQFPRFLADLSGVFDMRIYGDKFSVGRLVEDCSVHRRQSRMPLDGPRRLEDIDIHKLKSHISHLPIAEIRQRRKRLNVFYEEVLSSADPDKGINFTTVLMILAHYKVINDNKSLRLEEFLRRRARLQRVEDDVRRAIIANFLDMVYWSRRWREHMRKKNAGRMTGIPQLQVPEIFIEDEPLSPIGDRSSARPALSLRIPSATSASTEHSSGRDTNDATSTLRNRSDSIQMTPSSPTYRQSISPPRPTFDSGRLSTRAREEPPSPVEYTSGSPQEGGWNRSRANSNVSAIQVLDAFDNSAWGESIRRSVTTRRGSSMRSSGASTSGGDPSANT